MNFALQETAFELHLSPLFQIQIGMNARLFPGNRRPLLQEIAFAKENGFSTIQLPGIEFGLGKGRLGVSLVQASEALKTAGLTAVMEINIHLHENGLTANGRTPLEVLNANLPAIVTLPCPYVHWHLVPVGSMKAVEISRLEKSILPQFTAAVILARKYGFQFSFKHNAPDLMLFANPERCLETLRHVPGLGFVWDFNHVTPDKSNRFKALIPWTTMLHVSDTSLPEVNHHLPLGLGRVALGSNCRALLQGGFSGPAILEIGGQPNSGGYNQDTDEALIGSRQRLEQAILS